MKSSEIIQKNKEIVNNIKDYLDIVNYDFLVAHMSVNRSVSYRRRDSDDNYVYTHNLIYDSYAQQLLNMKDYIYVLNTELYDGYLNGLGYDELALTDESVEILKNKVCNTYSRYDHISILIGQHCIPSIWNNDFSIEERKLVESSLIQDLKSLGYQLDSLSEFEYQLNGYSIICEIEQFRQIKLKSLNGIWGNRVTYYNNDKSVSQEKSIDIPFSVKWMGIDWDIVDVADGFFNNCRNLETVVLPDNLKSFSWSFWNCPKLKEIRTKNNNIDPYSSSKIVSYKGVLYRILQNYDECELLAYPNMYASDFHIPEIIEVAHKRITVSGISKSGFKCCNNLESLHIPRNVKHIGINAFYRCNNLRFIYYYGKSDNIKIEGCTGDYGSVNPVWLCEATLPEMQPKVEFFYLEDSDNQNLLDFKIGGVRFRMIRIFSRNEKYLFVSKTTVTRSLWKIIMHDYPRGQIDEQCPIRVNYLQAQCFIKELSVMSGVCFRLPPPGIWNLAAKENERHHVKSTKTNDLCFYDMFGSGEFGEDIGLYSDNRVPIMGNELLESVHADSGEYAFRLYIDSDESQKLLQKCK